MIPIEDENDGLYRIEQSWAGLSITPSAKKALQPYAATF